ncbi:MAG: hypothetical protein HYZ48_03885 [Chlamydiales bacterium]|nr:hypothetical protein [Chlamydiales bacterium]
MKTLLYKIFIAHWARKLIALALAVITWLVVNQTLTSTRTINGIAVRVINIPAEKTIEGIQSNGRLTKKISLTLVGNRTVLDELTPYDLEVVLDASDKPDEWIATVSSKNLISLNPEVDISKGINRVYYSNFFIRMTKLVTEKIPVVITQPIGEAPRGYQFLDVWPYRLFLSVSGPEDIIKRLKLKEQRITFNLSDLNKAQLDALTSNSGPSHADVYGTMFLDIPLYANGVDRLFLETVEEMLQIAIIISPAPEEGSLPWSIEFINPRELENRYVSTLMSNSSDDETRLLQPALREEYLRNRFRSYMNRLQLFTSDEVRLKLKVFLKNNRVEVYHQTT